MKEKAIKLEVSFWIKNKRIKLSKADDMMRKIGVIVIKFFISIVGIMICLVMFRLAFGQPKVDIVSQSLAKTRMSKGAQKHVQSLLTCIEKNKIRLRILLPVLGRIQLPPIPGWIVIRLRQRLAIVDYSLSSTSNRMWIIDTTDGEIISNPLVRHGDGKGTQRKKKVSQFSNTPKSQLSSLGVILATFPAIGGYSRSWPSKRILLLEGQEKKWNSNIREREIIIHSTTASYSDGCLSMPLKYLDTTMLHLAFGGIIFSYYPKKDYLKHSTFLNCK